MLKNLILYRIGGDMPASAEALGEILGQAAFVGCGATQREASGWISPRGIEHGSLVEAQDGHWIICRQTEKRLLPTSVVDDRLEELCDQIEEQTGRRPGKKARKDLKEQAIHELLPKAFTKTTRMLAWIDTDARILAVDAGSQGRADELITLLVQHPQTGRMNLALLQTHESPTSCMAAWLMDGIPPEGFSIDSDAELKGSDEQRPIVKYARHPLDIDEVKAHLVSGKTPTKLGMSFRERVAFQLTEAGHIKRLSFLDLAFEGRERAVGDEAFDADMALATGELHALIAGLVKALGGEFVPPVEAAAAPYIANSHYDEAHIGSLKLENVPASSPQPVAPAADVIVPAHHGDAATDPLYDQSIAIVLQHRKASISLVQRYLRIGYNRAARLLERMEKEGLVTALSSDGNRQLLKEPA